MVERCSFQPGGVGGSVCRGRFCFRAKEPHGRREREREMSKGADAPSSPVPRRVWAVWRDDENEFHLSFKKNKKDRQADRKKERERKNVSINFQVPGIFHFSDWSGGHTTYTARREGGARTE